MLTYERWESEFGFDSPYRLPGLTKAVWDCFDDFQVVPRAAGEFPKLQTHLKVSDIINEFCFYFICITKTTHLGGNGGKEKAKIYIRLKDH